MLQSQDLNDTDLEQKVAYPDDLLLPNGDLQRRTTTLGQRVHFVNYVLTFALCISLVFIAWRELEGHSQTIGEPGIFNYFLNAPNGTVHSRVAERVYWDFDDDFLSFNLTRAHEFWAGLFPPGDGMVGLTDEQVTDMQLHRSRRGRSDSTKSVYLVGAFHQLHCLSVLRAQTIKLYHRANYTIPDSTYLHTMHCADVLRQAILCAADSTLIFRDESVKWPSDGSTIKCRNFEALRDWTTQHAYISVPDDPTLLDAASQQQEFNVTEAELHPDNFKRAVDSHEAEVAMMSRSR